MSAGPWITCKDCGQRHTWGPMHMNCPARVSTETMQSSTIEDPTSGLRLFTPRHDVPPRLQQAWEVRSSEGIRIEWRDVPLVIAMGEHANG